MNVRPSLKEIVAFLISFCGVVFMCCEVEGGELLSQVAVSLGGLAIMLIGIAVWFIWSKLEEVLKRDHR